MFLQLPIKICEKQLTFCHWHFPLRPILLNTLSTAFLQCHFHGHAMNIQMYFAEQ